MNNKLMILLLAAMMSLYVYSRPWRTANLTVELKDTDGNPITNATVTTKVSKGKPGGWGTDNDYYFTSATSDEHGIASVDFRIRDSDFDWRVKAPNHYSRGHYSPRGESLDCTVEESDYCHIDETTQEGIAKLNELKALEDAGDYASLTNYYAKFEPKSITYTENSIRRKVVMYPKRNPQPMITNDNWDKFMMMNTIIKTNGYALVVYKPEFVDLERGYVSTAIRKSMCRHADFTIERYCVETNGVKNTYGRITFDNGGGAYRCKQTGDPAFPAAYIADANATYMSSIEFHTIVDSATGKILSQKRPIESDEYLVVRTRMATDANGITGWHYSELIGPMDIGRRMTIDTAAFNPRFNDTNIEYDPSLH